MAERITSACGDPHPTHPHRSCQHPPGHEGPHWTTASGGFDKWAVVAPEDDELNQGLAELFGGRDA